MWSLTRMPAGRPAGARAIAVARPRASASMDQLHPYVNGIEPRPPRARARDLRVGSTAAERCLWDIFRARRLGGHKFRRQHPIPPWTADFACIEARLVIEMGGSQHGHE